MPALGTAPAISSGPACKEEQGLNIRLLGLAAALLVIVHIHGWPRARLTNTGRKLHKKSHQHPAKLLQPEQQAQ